MDGGSSWAVYQYYQYLSLAGTRDGITRGDGSRRRITIAAANFIRFCPQKFSKPEDEPHTFRSLYGIYGDD